MAYRVSIDGFEGPFDLLLRLVSRQQLDIGAISISTITSQYLAEVERMTDFDLDVASDFLVVASSLLQIKAASLLPKDVQTDELDDEFANLSPEETREILIERLLTYRQFRNAAAALGSRLEAENRMHPREAGIDPEFVGLMPDYLEKVTLHELAVICAGLAARRETFLLEAEHVAAVPISMERHLESIYRTINIRKKATFADLLGDDHDPEYVVVSFLAILELYKRGVVSVTQEGPFEDISINLEEDAPQIDDFSVPDWGMPDDPTLDEGDETPVPEDIAPDNSTLGEEDEAHAPDANKPESDEVEEGEDE